MWIFYKTGGKMTYLKPLTLFPEIFGNSDFGDTYKLTVLNAVNSFVL